MDNRIHKLPLQPFQINPIPKRNIQPAVADKRFAEHLKEAAAVQTGKLSISKHASMRMEQRQIDISPRMWEEIGRKVDEAKRKGVNDSLVLLKNAALIVSAKNSTVVTVMDRQEAGRQIFTNIDGTILMD